MKRNTSQGRPILASDGLIILLGRSGNGLTSVENQIREGTRLQILDSRGIGDPEEDITLADRKRHYAELFKDNQSQRLDAIVFVMKYGIRYTKQEKDAVQVVKYVFGDNVFKDKVVIVFTYGDLFDGNLEERHDTNTEFIYWCREQVGDIKTLFHEVDYRCVLFDNKTRDLIKKETQHTTFNENVNRARENQFNGVSELSPYLPQEQTRKIIKLFRVLKEKFNSPSVFVVRTVIMVPFRLGLI